MNRKEFSESLKRKSNKALIDLLNKGFSDKSDIDPDFLDLLIEELNSRKLSNDESKQFENLINSSFNELEQENSKSKTDFSADEIQKISKEKDREPGRYSSLKTVAGLISLLGYIVVIVGIGTLIFLLTQDSDSVLLGIIALVASVVIALPLLAFSNLISVIIDIEYNTRKSREALKK